jgi:hypothetical protein
MNNLNNAEFAQQLQRHISPADVQYFVDLKFPKELVQLIFVQEYRISSAPASEDRERRLRALCKPTRPTHITILRAVES